MRSLDQINTIKSRIEEPYVLDNFLTNEDISTLVSIFNSNNQDLINGYEGKIKKNTGPVTLNIKPFLSNPVVEKIFSKIKEEIGEFELNAGFFFKTDYPHIIHNDDTFELKDVYKAFTIPLEAEGNFSSYPHLCFFNQFYFQGPAKFFNEDSDIPTYYNKQVYDYADVENTTTEKIDPSTVLNYFTHLRPKWLKGLSLNSVLEWKPTTALVFDSVRLHCASDFRRLGITSKLGISIFTRKP